MKANVENIVRHADVSEKAIERYLCDQVKNLGGVCLKYSSANTAGYPDRVALLPGGRTIWIELKSKETDQITDNPYRPAGKPGTPGICRRQ